MSPSLISMDNSHVGVPTVEDANRPKVCHSQEQSATIAKHNTCSCPGAEAEAVHELENAFHDKLLLKDNNMEGSDNLPLDSTKSGTICHENTSCSYEERFDGSMEASSKCFHKCATFPVTAISDNKKSLTHSSSLPTPRKLVSALKGSREKEGVPPKKLTVSWAPDVYDPPPTSMSHYPRKKTQQQYKGKKKHGKGKHKGKNSRGGESSGKEKRHKRKSSGKSEPSSNSYAENDKVISSNSYRPPLGFLDFQHHVDDNISSPETSCGSSFLGKAGGSTIHYAYAEAT